MIRQISKELTEITCDNCGHNWVTTFPNEEGRLPHNCPKCQKELKE